MKVTQACCFGMLIIGAIQLAVATAGESPAPAEPPKKEKEAPPKTEPGGVPAAEIPAGPRKWAPDEKGILALPPLKPGENGSPNIPGHFVFKIKRKITILKEWTRPEKSLIPVLAYDKATDTHRIVKVETIVKKTQKDIMTDFQEEKYCITLSLPWETIKKGSPHDIPQVSDSVPDPAGSGPASDKGTLNGFSAGEWTGFPNLTEKEIKTLPDKGLGEEETNNITGYFIYDMMVNETKKVPRNHPQKVPIIVFVKDPETGVPVPRQDWKEEDHWVLETTTVPKVETFCVKLSLPLETVRKADVRSRNGSGKGSDSTKPMGSAPPSSPASLNATKAEFDHLIETAKRINGQLEGMVKTPG